MALQVSTRCNSPPSKVTMTKNNRNRHLDQARDDQAGRRAHRRRHSVELEGLESARLAARIAMFPARDRRTWRRPVSSCMEADRGNTVASSEKLRHANWAWSPAPPHREPERLSLFRLGGGAGGRGAGVGLGGGGVVARGSGTSWARPSSSSLTRGSPMPIYPMHVLNPSVSIMQGVYRPCSACWSRHRYQNVVR